MKKLLVVLGAFALLIATAVPVSAITRGGEPDAGEHPYVGLMVAHDADGVALWRCSGALISPTVFVTAGHCTEAPAVRAAIWFEEDVQSGIPGNGYPNGKGTSFAGTTYTHPSYDPDAFYLYDLGVVVLDGAGNAGLGSYAALPKEGALDGLPKGRKGAIIEAVGYGLQDIQPVTIGERVRLKADLMLINAFGQGGGAPLPRSITVSGDAKHGGTCFGDSGGPMFIGSTNVIGAVVSYGLNGNCAGIGGGYRIDLATELAWISSFLP